MSNPAIDLMPCRALHTLLLCMGGDRLNDLCTCTVCLMITIKCIHEDGLTIVVELDLNFDLSLMCHGIMC